MSADRAGLATKQIRMWATPQGFCFLLMKVFCHVRTRSYFNKTKVWLKHGWLVGFMACQPMTSYSISNSFFQAIIWFQVSIPI